jgi:hypothetical protein
MAGFKLDGGPLSGVSPSTLELLGQQAKWARAMGRVSDLVQKC